MSSTRGEREHRGALGSIGSQGSRCFMISEIWAFFGDHGLCWVISGYRSVNIWWNQVRLASSWFRSSRSRGGSDLIWWCQGKLQSHYVFHHGWESFDRNYGLWFNILIWCILWFPSKCFHEMLSTMFLSNYLLVI
jgi:hypothetical protein